MSKKRTLSMGLDEEEGELDDDGGYEELDLTPSKYDHTPKLIVNKKSPDSNREEFNEEDVPDFATYEDAIQFMKINRMKYAFHSRYFADPLPALPKKKYSEYTYKCVKHTNCPVEARLKFVTVDQSSSNSQSSHKYSWRLFSRGAHSEEFTSNLVKKGIDPQFLDFVDFENERNTKPKTILRGLKECVWKDEVPFPTALQISNRKQFMAGKKEGQYPNLIKGSNEHLVTSKEQVDILSEHQFFAMTAVIDRPCSPNKCSAVTYAAHKALERKDNNKLNATQLIGSTVSVIVEDGRVYDGQVNSVFEGINHEGEPCMLYEVCYKHQYADDLPTMYPKYEEFILQRLEQGISLFKEMQRRRKTNNAINCDC